MGELRVRTRRLGLLVFAALVLVVAAIAGYALGGVHGGPPLRRADPPPQRIDVGALQSPASIPPLCAGGCAPSP